MVYREGTQVINAHTGGAGIGFAGVGIGEANTSGTSQSLLSRDAAPPGGYQTTIMLITIAILMAIFGIFNRWWLLGTVAVIAFIAHILPRERQKHRTVMDRWSRTRMCLRCGHFYLP